MSRLSRSLRDVLTIMERLAEAKARGELLPSNHSSLFAPDPEPALRTGITAEVAVLRDLLNQSPEQLRKSVGRQPGD